MTCTWCPNEAAKGGRAPTGVSGLRFLAGCEKHANKIEKLKYLPTPIAEIERVLRLEAKQREAK